MPVTLQNVITRIRAKLNEPTPRFYSDTEITEWVNDGLRDIARRAEILKTYDTSISITGYGENPGQPIPTYPLNLGPQAGSSAVDSDILRITRVEFQVSGDSSQVYPLEWQPQSYLDQIWNIDQLSTMSYPAYYTTRGYPGGVGRNAFVIQLYPQPAQNGILNIFYYRVPTRLADPIANPSNYNSTIDLPQGWDDLIVDYAQVQGLIKARDPMWETIDKFYESKMAVLIDMTRQASDQNTAFAYDMAVMPWAFDSWGGF